MKKTIASVAAVMMLFLGCKIATAQTTNTEYGFVTPLIFNEWKNYKELEQWQKQTAAAHSLNEQMTHYVGKTSELAVLLECLPTGMRETDITVFQKQSDRWKFLLFYNTVVGDEVVVTQGATEVVIGTKNGDALLKIPCK